MPCDHVAEALPGLVDGSAKLDRAGRRHLDACLRCQADLARYRRVLRSMHQLGATVDVPPPGLLADVLAAVAAAADERPARFGARRVAYVGGIAAATAAAAGAGAAIVLTRGRRPRLPLAG